MTLEVSNRPEDIEHQFAGCRDRIDAFFEADQVDVVLSEILDRFEQFPQEGVGCGKGRKTTLSARGPLPTPA